MCPTSSPGLLTLLLFDARVARQTNPKLKNLEELVRGNMGFVFTNDDPKAVRDAIATCKVPAAARAGTFAPVDVFVPPGPTGMDPSQTAFFQALNIGTKIVKGAIEIINQVHLLKPGDKVGNSEVALLSKLNIKPFTFGLQIIAVRPFPFRSVARCPCVALCCGGSLSPIASRPPFDVFLALFPFPSCVLFRAHTLIFFFGSQTLCLSSGCGVSVFWMW
jgi:ribosomal protein L10